MIRHPGEGRGQAFFRNTFKQPNPGLRRDDGFGGLRIKMTIKTGVPSLSTRHGKHSPNNKFETWAGFHFQGAACGAFEKFAVHHISFITIDLKAIA